MRLTFWLAREPRWAVFVQPRAPHEWHGVVIRLHRLVIWFALR